MENKYLRKVLLFQQIIYRINKIFLMGIKLGNIYLLTINES